MIALFIDTALSYIRIALYIDDVLIDFVNEKCEKNMSSVFIGKVRDVFFRNNLDLKDVNKIYTVVGPGSFTGIRVGMTFSKVLALSLNLKITPISELQVLSSSGTCINAPIIDARRGYVYAGVYDENLQCIINDQYVLLDDFINDKTEMCFISYDRFDIINTVNPVIDFQKIYDKNKNKEQINHQILTPNYLKLTEAEEKLKENE